MSMKFPDHFDLKERAKLAVFGILLAIILLLIKLIL